MSRRNVLALMAIIAAGDTFQLFRGGGSDLLTSVDLRVQGININSNDDVPKITHELREVKDKILAEFKTNRNRSPCHTLASTTFEYSCSVLDTSARRKDENASTASRVEEAIQAYASRLAICELREAHAEIPDACKPFTPSENTRTKPSKESLSKCVKSLEDRSQSWTSYSNSKQNIFIICHALSTEARNEEILDIFEQFTRSAAEVGEHLLYAPHLARDLFEEVRSETRQFVASLYENEATKQRELKTDWNNLKNTMTHDISTTIQRFQEESLRLQTENSATTFHHLHELHTALSQLSSQASTLAVQQAENAATQQDQADFITALIQSDLVQAIGLATRGLADQQDIMHANHHTLLQLGTEMADLALRAEGAEQRLQMVDVGLRAIHAEAGKLQAAVNETGAALVGVRATAVELRESFEAAVSFFGSGWWMGGGLGSLTSFLALAGSFTLLAFGMWERWAGFSRLGAFCAALVSGFALASISTTHILPTFRCIPDLALHFLNSSVHFAQQQFEHQQQRTVAAGALVVLALFCLCLLYALRLIFKTQKQKRYNMAPYDPASPPVVAKWTV